MDGASRKVSARKSQICRFFNTKGGCRAGDACPYRHARHETPAGQTTTPDATRGGNTSSVDTSRIVQRPTPQQQVEDPRAFQTAQIRRRFKPEEAETELSSSFTFSMLPSDPDFPYDIESLECQLKVPHGYPSSARPSLRVTNKDIPRGFQINIEHGFDRIVSGASNATLLGLMNRLDKQLEIILSGEMAETIKLVANRVRADPVREASKPLQSLAHDASPSSSGPVTYSAEQQAIARSQRQADVRQLEARLGKLPLFSKSQDGIAYTLPLDSPKRGTWPPHLRDLKTVQLFVPLLYPLQPARVKLSSDVQEARAVETAFEARPKTDSNSTLMARINYLSQNIKDMATEQAAAPSVESPAVQEKRPEDIASVGKSQGPPGAVPDDARHHIQYIPRPPEWSYGAGEDNSLSDSDSNSLSYDTGDDTEDEGVGLGEDIQQPASTPAQRGVLLSFPNLELHGIELLEVTSLSITVKCERCKDMLDVHRLRNNAGGDASGMKQESCKKCANSLAVGYRADLMHANSFRAGYLDLDACTVVDMLTSNFTPTCSECSTPYPAPGVASVRGESAMAICRECHRRITFRIPEVKFLLVSAAAIRASRAPERKKTKETLGIVAGQELPRRGRCAHYSKSYRWFRFSCCGKVWACDRCHDEASDHPNEHANRMICGFCSREQNYRPEDCGTCHSVLVGRRGHGFWEGGKGTRDRARMSRKDPRKYKRRPAATKPKS